MTLGSAVAMACAVSIALGLSGVVTAAVRTDASLALATGPGLGKEVADEPARTELVELVRGPTEEALRAFVERHVIKLELGREFGNQLPLPV